MKDIQTPLQIVNRLLRLCLALIALLVIGLVVVIVVSKNASHYRDGKIEQLQRQQLKEAAATHKDIESVKNNMLCLGRYFSQQGRANITITDFDKCTFVNNTTGETGVLPDFNGNATLPSSSNSVAGQSNTEPANPSSTGSSQPANPTTPAPVSVGNVLPNCSIDVLFIHLGC